MPKLTESPQDRRTLTGEYLDAAKAALGLSSDYALAKRLDISKSTLAGIRRGVRAMPLILIIKLAITLERDPLLMVAELQLLAARNPGQVAFWRSFTWRAVMEAVMACTRVFGCFGSFGSGPKPAGGPMVFSRFVYFA
jgi:hypothetical protein